MVCGPRHRRFASLARITGTLALVGAAALGCGNIGLSSSDSFTSAGPSGGSGTDLHETDGGTIDSSLSPGSGGASDAGATSTSTSNPLCNLAIENEAGLPCRSSNNPTGVPDKPTSPNGASCFAPDGGAIAYTDASAGADAGDWLLSCHVVIVDNARTQACAVPGGGQDGDSCQTGADCAAAYECVGMPGRCRHYCCDGDKSCNGGATTSFCDIQPTAETNALKVPVCSPVSPCKLLTSNACASDETCAIVKDDGTTSCVTIGPAQVGQGCDTTHCADGLTCLGKAGARTCYKLCRIGYPADCGSAKCKGSAQLFSDPSYGICQ